jgi:hypothetical protein
MLDIPNSLKQFGNLLRADALYTLRNPLQFRIYYISWSINSDIEKLQLLLYLINFERERRYINKLIILYHKWSKY